MQCCVFKLSAFKLPFTCRDSFGPEADQPQTRSGSDTAASLPCSLQIPNKNTDNVKGEWSLIPDTGTQALQPRINEPLTRHRC